MKPFFMCVIAQDTNFYRSGYCTLYKILDWKDISDGWFFFSLCLLAYTSYCWNFFCYFRGCIGTRMRPCWAFFSGLASGLVMLSSLQLKYLIPCHISRCPAFSFSGLLFLFFYLKILMKKLYKYRL